MVEKLPTDVLSAGLDRVADLSVSVLLITCISIRISISICFCLATNEPALLACPLEPEYIIDWICITPLFCTAAQPPHIFYG